MAHLHFANTCSQFSKGIQTPIKIQRHIPLYHKKSTTFISTSSRGVKLDALNYAVINKPLLCIKTQQKQAKKKLSILLVILERLEPATLKTYHNPC